MWFLTMTVGHNHDCKEAEGNRQAGLYDQLQVVRGLENFQGIALGGACVSIWEGYSM